MVGHQFDGVEILVAGVVDHLEPQGFRGGNSVVAGCMGLVFSSVLREGKEEISCGGIHRARLK